jgi:hypothetical protein
MAQQTPKEKAEELFYKFRNIESDKSWIDNFNAKKCALITVDEAINMFIGVHKKFIELDMLKGSVEETATFQYWQEVKQEIEKL